jgi:hypothetical protein
MTERLDHLCCVEPEGSPCLDERDSAEVDPVVQCALGDAESLSEFVYINELLVRVIHNFTLPDEVREVHHVQLCLAVRLEDSSITLAKHESDEVIG